MPGSPRQPPACSRQPGPPPGAALDRARRLVFPAVCCLGISAVLTQLVLMRELLCALGGNELIVGLVLGCWFLLTGLGATLGRSAGALRRPIGALVIAELLVAVLPVASVFALRALRNVVFVRGAEVGPAEALAACGVLLGPYCLLTGYLLTLACALLSARPDAADIGKVYVLDVLGDIAGGLLFTFVLVGRLEHFEMLYVPAALNVLMAVAITAARRRYLAAAAGLVLAAAAGVAAATVDLDALSTRMEYAGRRVVFRGTSPYGQLVVLESAGQFDFLANGVPLFSAPDPQRAEQAVHYALAQRPAARRVLLIGGGVTGSAAEILKWPVERVDYVELDPAVIEVARRFAPGALADRRIVVHPTDGRLFVRRARGPYDVVIVDVPDPATSQINRLYTAEFFRQVRRILSPGGVLAVGAGQYANYVSDELAALLGTLARTLREAFAHVSALPTERVTLLASDGELTDEIAGRIRRAGIPTCYVHPDFLRATLAPDRLADIRRVLDAPAEPNRDFAPVLYYRQLVYWLSRHGARLALPAVAAAAALLALLVRLRAGEMAVFTAGFAASALEVVILLGFQTVHGCLYHRVGLMVTAFMAGLAGGAYLAGARLDRWGRGTLARVVWAVAAFAAALPVALPGLSAVADAAEGFSAWVAFPLLAAGPGVLVGMVFPLAGKVEFAEVTATASRLYAADYVGGCAGALLVSTVLLPLVGVWGVCLIVAALNVASGLLVRLSR